MADGRRLEVLIERCAFLYRCGRCQHQITSQPLDPDSTAPTFQHSAQRVLRTMPDRYRAADRIADYVARGIGEFGGECTRIRRRCSPQWRVPWTEEVWRIAGWKVLVKVCLHTDDVDLYHVKAITTPDTLPVVHRVDLLLASPGARRQHQGNKDSTRWRRGVCAGGCSGRRQSLLKQSFALQHLSLQASNGYTFSSEKTWFKPSQ